MSAVPPPVWRKVPSVSSVTGLGAKPIGRNGRRQYADGTDAGAPDMGERQQQKLHIGLGAVLGAAR